MMNDKIFSKLRAILELSKSERNSNQHEAENAMRMAYQLLQKHNLTIQDIQKHDIKKDIMDTKIDLGIKTLGSKYRCANSIILKFFNIRTIVDYTVDTLEITFIGKSQDVKIAEYIFDFLVNQFERQWQEYRKANKVPGRMRNSFIQGMYQGIYLKLEAEKKKARSHSASDENALILTNQAIDQYVAEKYSNIKNVNYKTKAYSSAYDDGQKAGQNVGIKKGVAGVQKQRNLLRG